MDFREFNEKTNLELDIYSKIKTYLTFLTQWNQAYNLVQKDSLKEFWTRHVLDSLELFPYIKEANQPIVDLGTGAGFPGLILAIAGVKSLILVDSSKKRTIFLEYVKNQLSLPVTVLCQRIEELPPIYHYFVARALTHCEDLLRLCQCIQPTGYFKLWALKGPKIYSELDQVQNNVFFLRNSFSHIYPGKFSNYSYVWQFFKEEGKD